MKCQTCLFLKKTYKHTDVLISKIESELRELSKKNILVYLGEISSAEAEKIYTRSFLHCGGVHYECVECHSRLLLIDEDHAFLGTFDRYELRRKLFRSDWVKTGMDEW